MRKPKRKVETFVDFVASLGVTLTAAQRVVALVAFDGVAPSALGGAEREIARAIFGEVEVVSAVALAVFVAVCGARGGKSYVFCALRALHLALTGPTSTLAPGERGYVVLVAPDMRLAAIVLDYALGAARSSPRIAARIRNVTADGFVLARAHGREVAIEVLPASRGGSAVRGRSLLGFIVDECGFFRDADSVVNDRDVFDAGTKRVVAGGQTIIASTPWSEVGLLHELFTENHGRPVQALAAHAPTMLLRDGDARVRAMVDRERERDPDAAAYEYDALFRGGGGASFFDARAIDASIVDALPPPVAGVGYGVGIDVGLKVDSSALRPVGSHGRAACRRAPRVRAGRRART